MLKQREIRIIASANSIEKCDSALAAGADYASLDDPQNLPDAVAQYTKGQGVDVLFDSVGPALFDTSLKILRKKGMFIHYGANSGAIGAIDPMQLANAGSLYFVRPRLNDHIGTRNELVERSQRLFSLWATGQISSSPHRIYELSDIGVAHQALETRQSIGKSIVRIMT
jgi:NADPH2:quinone reductase